MNFNELVQQELDSARSKYPIMFHSHHEAYAVLKEEVDEYWDEVKKKNSNKENMKEEIIQIAAIAKAIYQDLLEEK